MQDVGDITVVARSPPTKKRKAGRHIEINVNDVEEHLLGIMKRPPECQKMDLDLDIVHTLCSKSSEIFMSQPMLLELDAPLSLLGDIHGQYRDLLRMFEICRFPPETNYLFLGDYVDRGKQSLETICLLLAYKIRYPEHFFLLRGNHETPSISRIYGFYDECKRQYNVKLWKTFCHVFNCLPVCAIIEDRIICMHGGLSEDMMHVELRTFLNEVPRPADVPDSGILCDLLWSDPQPDSVGFGPNDRGVSVSFGEDIVTAFLQKANMDLVVRAHQVVEDGYEFFAGQGLVTVFSAPNYCGEFDNAAGILLIRENLCCGFYVYKPNAP
eukprot:TRINITY_DN7890_c0_g3_i1.p1 TRINITY_DN7890_c0_g3~~TRINITY_DN7890_c0_g3_i1.p1  ORF type:complete len:326 (+),score=52.40 TRINITY_DN7890_c0_g3_i1:190-1167(+)